MSQEMHIASAIVFTLPRHVDEVAARIGRLPPIRLHGTSPAGKLVVTLEGGTSGEIMDQVGALQQLDQVINVALVFQSIEPEEEASETSEAADHNAATSVELANDDMRNGGLQPGLPTPSAAGRPALHP